MNVKNILAIIVLALTVSLIDSCTDDIKVESKKDISISQCPCDSMGTFKIKGKNVTYAYIGISQIEISHFANNDTIEITRRYTTDSIWHFQEKITVLNSKIIDPEYAIYCDIKDTADFYKLTFISTEFLYDTKDLKTINVIGTELIINNDTIHSHANGLLVPKAKFSKIVKIDKRSNVIFEGKKNTFRSSILLEAESMIKYGSLLEQYKAITKFCNTDVVKKTN